jgi:hypothetical protein
MTSILPLLIVLPFVLPLPRNYLIIRAVFSSGEGAKNRKKPLYIMYEGFFMPLTRHNERLRKIQNTL